MKDSINKKNEVESKIKMTNFPLTIENKDKKE